MRAAWIGIAAALLLCFAAPARAESGIFDLTTETDILIGGSAGTPSWVKRAGDVNGDGAQDLLVSSWSRVYVLFGPLSPGTSDLDTLAERGFYIEGTGYELYGSRTAAVGDMNGDGLDDIIVGAPAHHRGETTQAGAAYVVFGKASTEPVLVDSLGSQGFLIEGPDYGNNTYGPALGSVDGAGDVNGDGRPDVIVGSQQDSRHNYVVFGKADTGTVDVTALGAGGFAIRHENSGIWLGYSVAGVGDMNGDGLDDVALGASLPVRPSRSRRPATGVFASTVPTPTRFLGIPERW
jgi:FG-GAP repeat protein/VCBS repeat protein